MSMDKNRLFSAAAWFILNLYDEDIFLVPKSP